MKKLFNIRYIAIVCAVVYLSVSLISAQFDLMTKKQQLTILNQQQERIQLETQDIERMLEYESQEDYVERIARQRLGYANPNETIYKDIQGE